MRRSIIVASFFVSAAASAAPPMWGFGVGGFLAYDRTEAPVDGPVGDRLAGGVAVRGLYRGPLTAQVDARWVLEAPQLYLGASLGSDVDLGWARLGLLVGGGMHAAFAVGGSVTNSTRFDATFPYVGGEVTVQFPDDLMFVAFDVRADLGRERREVTTPCVPALGPCRATMSHWDAGGPAAFVTIGLWLERRAH
jgi:hypothetical protein